MASQLTRLTNSTNSSLLLLGFFLFWRRGGIEIEGDGCGMLSVASGDDRELSMDARKTVPTVAVC